MFDATTIQAIAALAKRGQILEVNDPTVREEAVYVGENSGALFSIKHLMDEWRHQPERVKGEAKCGSLEAFINLVNRHKSDDSCIFADMNVKKPSFLGVIDYTKRDHTPQFGQHRIRYDFPVSVEWAAWSGNDGKILTQLDFAQFIEDHVADLRSVTDEEKREYEGLFRTRFADPSDMITVSRGLAITVESNVNEIRTLQSGEAQISYEEVHKQAGERATVPGLFLIEIPLFNDGDSERLVARLRYRKIDARLKWFYELYRVEHIVRKRINEDFEHALSETDLDGFEALPEV